MHRDLKPENLFLVPTRSGEDFVKILDFGISKFTSPGMTSATMTGAVLGSPFYMAPEQARGLKNVDPRTDLYSVGTLLFECVTGRVPFDGDNFNDLMFKIALAPRPNPLELRPDLDPGLVPIIIKSIQADANDRYETAELFRDAPARLARVERRVLRSQPGAAAWNENRPRAPAGRSRPPQRRGRGTPVPGTPTPSTPPPETSLEPGGHGRHRGSHAHLGFDDGRPRRFTQEADDGRLRGHRRAPPRRGRGGRCGASPPPCSRRGRACPRGGARDEPSDRRRRQSPSSPGRTHAASFRDGRASAGRPPASSVFGYPPLPPPSPAHCTTRRGRYQPRQRGLPPRRRRARRPPPPSPPGAPRPRR